MDEVISTSPLRQIPLFFHPKWSKEIALAPWPAQQPLITLALQVELLNDLLILQFYRFVWIDQGGVFFLFYCYASYAYGWLGFIFVTGAGGT
jgi:hypothetical protein